MKKTKTLPKEIMVGWFGEKDDEYLSANNTPEDALLSAGKTQVTCGRYVLKEQVVITQKTQVTVMRK